METFEELFDDGDSGSKMVKQSSISKGALRAWLADFFFDRATGRFGGLGFLSFRFTRGKFLDYFFLNTF